MSTDWLEYFEGNRTGRMRIPWEMGVHVEPHLRKPLIKSLQRFQVGEQGEGVHLKRGAARTGDPRYAATIELFIKEEQEHSRLLANVLRGMGAPLIRWHWSDACFVLVRRMLGLKLELMVLLVAEMIAKRYYRMLRDGTQDPVVKAMCEQILHDEQGHVAFHCDYLRGALAHLPFLVRMVVHFAWRCFFYGVCLLVMYDHRQVMRATGVSPSEFWCDCDLIFSESAGSIFGSGRGTVEQVALLSVE
jgi:hypothetical protein